MTYGTRGLNSTKISQVQYGTRRLNCTKISQVQYSTRSCKLHQDFTSPINATVLQLKFSRIQDGGVDGTGKRRDRCCTPRRNWVKDRVPKLKLNDDCTSSITATVQDTKVLARLQDGGDDAENDAARRYIDIGRERWSFQQQFKVRLQVLINQIRNGTIVDK